nr:MAG TPA: hypothetical protein [Bacteriophage sp.]
MKKCVEEFLNAIDPEIDTSELARKIISEKPDEQEK